MRIIRPITVDSGNLVLDSTNIPQAPPPAYDSGATYADGDVVAVLQGDGFTWKVYESLVDSNTGNAVTDDAWWLYVADTYDAYDAGDTYAEGARITSGNHVYESLAGGNTGHPVTDPAWWLDIGATNAYAMFDKSNTTQAARAESITFEVSVSGRADAIGLLNIVGATVDIAISTEIDGEIYNETFDLVSNSGIDNWYEYYFEPIVRRGDLVVYNLPNYANTTFTVTLHEPSSTAKIGVALFGQSKDLGDLLYGAKTGIQDYSRKEADEFGNFTIVQRNYAKRGSYKILVDNDRVDAISAVLAAYRAEAVLWVGADQFASTWVYGFYRDFNIEIAFYNQSYLTLELEGLT